MGCGGVDRTASVSSPEALSASLRRIADSVDSPDAVPSRKLLGTKIRILVAALEQDLVLLFRAGPDESVRGAFDSDDGSVQDAVDLELMQAGAKSVDWDMDSCYVVVPPGSKVSVLRAFNDMKDGSLGEEVSEFLRPLWLSDAEEGIPKAASTISRAAARIARRKKSKPILKKVPRSSKPVKTEDMLASSTEYSCKVDLSLTADFEGSVGKQKLLKKLRTELVAAIQGAVSVTAREYGLDPTGVHVKPIKVECAVIGLDFGPDGDASV